MYEYYIVLNISNGLFLDNTPVGTLAVSPWTNDFTSMARFSDPKEAIRRAMVYPKTQVQLWSDTDTDHFLPVWTSGSPTYVIKAKFSGDYISEFHGTSFISTQNKVEAYPLSSSQAVFRIERLQRSHPDISFEAVSAVDDSVFHAGTPPLKTWLIRNSGMDILKGDQTWGRYEPSKLDEFEEFINKGDAIERARVERLTTGEEYWLFSPKDGSVEPIDFSIGTGGPEDPDSGSDSKVPFGLDTIEHEFVQLIAIKALGLRQVYTASAKSKRDKIWAFLWKMLIQGKKIDWDKTIYPGEEADLAERLIKRCKEAIRLLKRPEFRKVFLKWTKDKTISKEAKEVIRVFMVLYTGFVSTLIGIIDLVLTPNSLPTHLVTRFEKSIRLYTKYLRVTAAELGKGDADEAWKHFEELAAHSQMKKAMFLNHQSLRIMREVMKALKDKVDKGSLFTYALTPNELQEREKLEASEEGKRAAAAAAQLKADNAKLSSMGSGTNTPKKDLESEGLRQPSVTPGVNNLLEIRVGVAQVIAQIDENISASAGSLATALGTALHNVGLSSATFIDTKGKVVIIAEKTVRFMWLGCPQVSVESTFNPFGFTVNSKGIYHTPG